uniref:OCEL domain-containing protein n=1 Tax=Nothoprocta perdicaria TaxID=30464 RepID=A0A8C6ZWA5_NOTPE
MPPLALASSLPPASRLSPLPQCPQKYPAIRSAPQREQYKAVFCDQLAEYRELRGRLRAARRALGELDALMSRAPRRAPRWERVSNGEQWEPQPGLSLLEKQERCNYLRKKLLHIKSRIREYDHAAPESSVCF